MIAENEWRDEYSRNVLGLYGEPADLLVRGKGARVWDAAGRELLDFLAGIAVNSLGHAHPVVVDAVTRQISTLAHVSNLFTSEPQIRIAEKLKEIAGTGDGGRVFLCNSGAEANEAAFKLARRHSTGGRTRILTLVNSFHGRTMGALALTGKPGIQAPFEPMPGGVEHIEATIEALEAAMGDDVAALLVEPIQGEAGVSPLPDGFLKRARELTEKHGALLMIDEIQTGVGRTGDWFAFEREGIAPDAVTVAKGLAGGVPIGALIVYPKAAALLETGQHGTTFGGNPLAAATALAVLGEIDRARLREKALENEAALRDAIAALASPLVAGVRGRGLLLGVELSKPVGAELVRASLAEGLIVNSPNPHTIRLAPPLIVGAAEIAEFSRAFGRALTTIGESA